ncbi:NEL-type E3 ubiquitin ligase domain-containing protein [Pseudomonas synxantha]|uniref:NEL domain-containing protein n=1 Tax=Pseudomonas synxantha TaxID=47883 RepID=A0A5D3GCY2_9PSED|nr:NEL-type E3 ubiquitin ligase domain-containing protein [Pseudomonas synxantha]TYK58020.1 hypothetical protein FXO26_12260 [Pseudomonas synxantha]
MPELRILALNNTQIRDWPIGLFELPRSPDFNLNLLNTPITQVPIVEPGSVQAELVTRARLDNNKLERDAEDRLVSYRRAAGLDPYRTYPPRGELDSQFWLEHLTPEIRQGWQEIWDDLEREHGSQGFFEVIRSQRQPTPDIVHDPADLLRYNQNLRQLRTNVLRLLRAADSDEQTRTALFNLSAMPTHCADAGAQLFNAMGIEAMKLEAWREPTPQARTDALVHAWTRASSPRTFKTCSPNTASPWGWTRCASTPPKARARPGSPTSRLKRLNATGNSGMRLKKSRAPRACLK